MTSWEAFSFSGRPLLHGGSTEEVYIHLHVSFLTQALEGCGWRKPRPDRFNPRKEPQHQSYRKVSVSDGRLDGCGEEKISYPTGVRTSNPTARWHSPCRLRYFGPQIQLLSCVFHSPWHYYFHIQLIFTVWRISFSILSKTLLLEFGRRSPSDFFYQSISSMLSFLN